MSSGLPPITDSPPPSDLKTRAIVGVILIAVALGVLYLGGLAFSALIGVGVLLVFAEWAVMHGITRIWRLIGLVVVGLTVIGAHYRFYEDAVLGLIVAALIFGLLTKLAKVAGMRWSTTGLLYAGLPAIALIWLRAQSGGFGFVLWVLVVVWATDIGAYFAGRKFGGPKLAPAISPKKTWSGLIGGMIAAALASATVAYFQQWHPILWLAIFAALGAVAAVVSQMGDLFESWLKRRVGVKDSGTLLPGHGGIMDRVDGLVPVAIAAAALLGYLT